MNDDITPHRLMKSGRKLFADNGFDGASIREITRAAQANLGAVTYHFGSKRALYYAILEDVFTDLAVRTEAAAVVTGPATDRLRGIVAAFFAFFRAAPDAPRLVIREIAGGAPPPPVVPLMRRNLVAIQTVIRDGQADGSFRALEPFLAAFSIISQSVWFAVVSDQLPTIAGIPLPPDLSVVVERHVADVIHRSVQRERTA